VDTQTQQVVILAIGLVLIGVLMFWPQWQTRRRRQRQMAELHVGDEVMTVGGIIGKLTYFNADKDRARIEIAPEVEIQVVLAAISRTLTSRDA
jgi:preprotein translocase subunit YajC